MKGTKLTKPTVSQTFSLPKPLIYYISKNANSAVYFKLYKTCTYFFLQGKWPLCHYLIVNYSYGSNPGIFPQAALLELQHFNEIVLKKLTVTNTFSVYCERPTAFLELLPKLQLRIKHLVLLHQEFGLNECHFLANLNLESIYLSNVKIFLNKNEIISAKKIIQIFSTCYSIT